MLQGGGALPGKESAIQALEGTSWGRHGWRQGLLQKSTAYRPNEEHPPQSFRKGTRVFKHSNHVLGRVMYHALPLLPEEQRVRPETFEGFR